jgi:GTP pyrophosphokinase
VITRSGDRFEIQIRTQEMHNESEYCSAAHWAYNEKIKADDNSWIIRLKEFLENDEYFKNPYELQELLKSELKTDFIHVLTPKGDIKTLPKGATPIDFAFLVHTDLGHKITGARINGKFAKLTSQLHSGDVLEVKTSKNASPSRDWLNFVKTAKARSKIMLWLKKNEKEELIEDGKRMWEKFKKKFKHKLEGFDLEQSFKNNLNSIGFKSTDDFYSAISTRSLKLSQTLLRRIYPEPFKRAHIKKVADKEKQASLKNPDIEVDGMKNIITTLSKCCNPIKGEPIVAYVTKRSSIKIHSARCEKILRGEFEESRLKDAKWLTGQSTQVVRLKLIGDNYNDMLNALVEKAAEEGIVLRALKRKDIDDNLTSIHIEIEVKDIFQLKRFVSKVHASRHIDSVINN